MVIAWIEKKHRVVMSYPAWNSPGCHFHVVRKCFGCFANKDSKSALSYFPYCCFQLQTKPGFVIEGGFPFGHDPCKKCMVNVPGYAIRNTCKIQMTWRLKWDYFVVEWTILSCCLCIRKIEIWISGMLKKTLLSTHYDGKRLNWLRRKGNV